MSAPESTKQVGEKDIFYRCFNIRFLKRPG